MLYVRDKRETEAWKATLFSPVSQLRDGTHITCTKQHTHTLTRDVNRLLCTHTHTHTHILFLSFSIFVSERFLRNGRLCLFVVGNNLVDNGLFANEIAATIQKTNNGGILTNDNPLWPNL